MYNVLLMYCCAAHLSSLEPTFKKVIVMTFGSSYENTTILFHVFHY